MDPFARLAMTRWKIDCRLVWDIAHHQPLSVLFAKRDGCEAVPSRDERLDQPPPLTYTNRDRVASTPSNPSSGPIQLVSYPSGRAGLSDFPSRLPPANHAITNNIGSGQRPGSSMLDTSWVSGTPHRTKLLDSTQPRST